MTQYKLKVGRIGKKVIGIYCKIENAFVNAFLEKADADDEQKGQ